jgi:hypothetical protein
MKQYRRYFPEYGYVVVRPELKENETRTWKIIHKNAGSCFTSSLQGMYIVFVIFQTAIVKGRNRNSYEYINCTTDPYSGK